MILSMTGFGRATAQSETKKITIEIKSLNSKQLDLQMRLPSYFREFDVTLRPTIAARMERGKAELSTVVESLAAETPACVNTSALKNYKAQIEAMSEELGLPEPTDWYSVLLRMPDAMQARSAEASDSDREAFVAAVDKALDELTEYRRIEGAKLEKFFAHKIENIGALLLEVEPHEKERVVKIRERLEQELSRLDSIDYDRGRLEQELIFYIEKLDVNEEKQRLRSHLNYFAETLTSPEAEGKGKKLGFIAQEMGREINTLGSKSNNADMQRIVVKMKDELEQIKEQVLNVL